MRPNFVLGILLAAGLALGALAFLKRHPGPSAPPAVVASVPAPTPMPRAIFSEPTAPPPAPAPALTPEEQQAADDAEIDRLQDWSASHDPQSLSNILADLGSPEKGVREAAIEAARQFQSTNAIPALKAAAMSSTDTDEQMEMLEAANFLSQPFIDASPPTPEEVQARQQQRAKLLAQMKQQQGQRQNPNGSGAQAPPQAPQQ
ncbi:MAG: hypothetical protein ACREFR_00105 [Limisphaerales bacterium]